MGTALLLAILIVDLPPTPYEPPVECYEGYELSDTNECIRVELQSCLLKTTGCDNGCNIRKAKWNGKWWRHKHRRHNRCDSRLPNKRYGVKEVVIRDDGEILAESTCELIGRQQ